jgi:glycosyltransferase involved in cell wall biosynthesis
MIAVSEAVRRALLACRLMAPERIVTVLNGIDLTRSLPHRDGLRQSVGLDSRSAVVGFVGRLAPEKGLETLLAATRLLVSGRWPQLRVFLVGDDPQGGAYAGRLRRLVREYGLAQVVHFFGYVADAGRASADFDIHVVCSDAEPFGLVTLEGMAHCHPVVATASGGSPEIIRDGIDGYLVPPRDPGALARRLEKLLSRQDLCRRLGQRARQRVEKAFSLHRMLDGTEAVYRRVLRAAPR